MNNKNVSIIQKQGIEYFKMITESDIERWRYDTFWEKEYETIMWIDSFTDGHFVDIGANVGLYSLYCADSHPEMIVLAFEPFKANYDRLIENAKLNGFDNIVAANVAIGAYTGVFNLKCVSDQVGSSGHQLNEGEGDICACVSLNNFKILSKIPLNYIKIDTDGNEYDIIKNAEIVLADPALRSALVEVNDHKKEIVSIFERYGFTMDNRFNSMTPHSRTRRQEEGIAAENIVFTRE